MNTKPSVIQVAGSFLAAIDLASVECVCFKGYLLTHYTCASELRMVYHFDSKHITNR